MEFPTLWRQFQSDNLGGLASSSKAGDVDAGQENLRAVTIEPTWQFVASTFGTDRPTQRSILTDKCDR